MTRVLRKTAVAAYAAIVILFVLGYVSRWLPPEAFWWTGIPATAIPYLSLIIVLASLPVFLLALRGWRIVQGVLIVLILFRFAPSVHTSAISRSEQDHLVVASFNAPVRGPDPAILRQKTLDLMVSLRPDVVALQEPVMWWEKNDRAWRLTGHAQILVDSLGLASPRPQRRSGRFQQPLLSTARILEMSQVQLSGSSAGSQASRTLLSWRGRPFVVYNVHLHTTGERKPWHDENPRPLDPRFWWTYLRDYREAYLRRAREVRRLRRLLDEEMLPMLLVGDFNATMHQWEYRVLRGDLTDAFRAAGRGWGATYHARWPLVRIDHIFVSDEWGVETAYVSSGHDLSDHRPVVARIHWRP